LEVIEANCCAHACNPSHSRKQRSGGLRFEASLGKQFLRSYLKKTHHKKRAGGVAQAVGPEFKPRHCKEEKKRKKKKGS
jgi:hypothetical protein